MSCFPPELRFGEIGRTSFAGLSVPEDVIGTASHKVACLHVLLMAE